MRIEISSKYAELIMYEFGVDVRVVKDFAVHFKFAVVEDFYAKRLAAENFGVRLFDVLCAEETGKFKEDFALFHLVDHDD